MPKKPLTKFNMLHDKSTGEISDTGTFLSRTKAIYSQLITNIKLNGAKLKAIKVAFVESTSLFCQVLRVVSSQASP